MTMPSSAAPGPAQGPERPIDFTLPDHAGGSFRFADALRERSVVLVFYRGDW